ncbi:MAG: SCO family protein [Planctomycetota bacterium]|jgi:protein SCO1/2
MRFSGPLKHHGRITRPARWAAACLVAAGTARAQPGTGAPPEAEGIGITEHLGDQLPLSLVFTDESGERVSLGDYFNDDKPVVLTLVYYRCPAICNALLNGMVYTLNDMESSAGEEFRIVTVSFDPSETHELADAKKRNYLSSYERDTGTAGWSFLVGEASSTEALCEAVGFEYRYEPRTGLFTHAASLMICTPDGRLSRYINDVVFEPETLRLALTEASEGTIGTPVQRFLLKWCYTYDPGAGKYVVAARKLMMFGGAAMVLLTFAGLGVLWRYESKRLERRKAEAAHGAAIPGAHS